MFTGIVEEKGTVRLLKSSDRGMRLTITADRVVSDLEVGSSVAVNGVCLTAVAAGDGEFEVDVVPETIARSNLSDLVVGSTVNLERPLAAAGRFDGHIVQGHVDGVGEVLQVLPEGEGSRLRLAIPKPLRRYVVEKGSLAVDGVSLTVAAVAAESAEVALIPHTLAVTVLGERSLGDRVNLEVDVIAKYVERLMEEKG